MRRERSSTEREEGPKPRRRWGRLPWLLALGVLLVGGAFALRNSPWARERQLSRLSSNSLALLALERPNDARVFQHLGARLYAEGDVRGSLDAYHRAVTLEPKNAETQLGAGIALAAAQQPYEAERRLVEAARLQPKDPRPHFVLAKLYDTYRNKTSTIAPLEKVTELDPQNAEAWYLLGTSFGDLHQFDRALDALQKAARYGPERAVYHRDLAQVQMHFGKQEDARASLSKARALEPRDPGTLVLLAKIDLDQGATDERLQTAESLLKEAIAIDDRYSAAYRELGTLHARRRQMDEAVPVLRKAVKLDPTDGQALFQLAQALLRTGHDAEGQRLMKGFKELSEARRSVSSLEDRIHQDPKNPDLRLRVARLYRRYGVDDRAVNQYQVYLSMKPADAAVTKELTSYRQELQKAAGGKQPASAP
jgi:Flp pilus assembly protein TadD